MMATIKEVLFYAGCSCEDFMQAQRQIRDKNRIMLNVLLCLAVVLIGGMFISTFFVDGVITNRIVYGCGTMFSLGLLGASLGFAKRYDCLVTPLMYITCSVYYIYGIAIGIATDPGQKTVTFMVLLVFLPTLFVDRPIRFIAVMLVYVAVFIYLCLVRKSGNVLGNDVLDAVVFGLLGVANGTITNVMKVRRYILEQRLTRISRVDRLTGINNRNAYELDCNTILRRGARGLACIYMDANGLKQLNDIYGHRAGDEMLITVAHEIVEIFGREFVYRMGGDEFVAFMMNPEGEVVERAIAKVILRVERHGYHIAVGWEECSVAHPSVERLMRDAEVKMYQAKARFYREAGGDRNHLRI